jgi:type II secretion system protein N
MKRLAKILTGALWFFLCLIIGIKLFFPTEAVRQRLVYSVEEATKGSFALILEDVGAWTLSGITADEVQLLRQKKKKGRRAKEQEVPEPSLFAAMETISARVKLLPLLSGSKLLSFKGDAYDGSVSGEVGLDGQVVALGFKAEDLDVSQYPLSLPDGEPLQLVGRLKFESDLRLDQEDVDDSKGSVRLEIEDLSILNEAFADVFSEAVLEFENDDGKLVVKKGAFLGDKMQAELSGDIQLNKRIGKSRLDLKIELTLDTSYDLLAKTSSGLKRARDKDGVYHFQCTGTLERRRCNPDRKAARGKTGNSSRPNRSDSAGKPDDRASGSGRFSPDESAEERRERRQERIRSRRARSKDREGRGGNGDRVRPETSRSRRGRRDRADEDDFGGEEPIFEDEPPFDDDVPLPELEDLEEEPYQDDLELDDGDLFLDE